MDMYAEQILDAYRNPHHMGTLKQPDFSAEDSNPLCGDQIRFEMKLGKNGKIKSTAFGGVGCAISTAAASLLTDFVLGKTPIELERITTEQVLHMIGVPLSPSRVKCGMLAAAVMKQSILKKKYRLPASL